MKERSKKLSRQIKKAFGEDNFEEVLSSSISKMDPDVGTLLLSFPNFLDSIEEAYSQQEKMLNVVQTNLDVGSKELTESNKKLFHLNQAFDAMVNAIGQGFLLFDENLICLDISSKACQSLLEIEPRGKNIAEVLRVTEENLVAFRAWGKLLFEDKFDFEDLCTLGPKTFQHSEKRAIYLEYKPVRDQDKKLSYVLVIATDRTEEIQAKTKAEQMSNLANLIVRVAKNSAPYNRFVRDTTNHLEELKKIIDDPALDKNSWIRAKQLAHNIKGNAGTFFLIAIVNLCHDFESKIAAEFDKEKFLLESQSFLTEVTTELNNAKKEIRDLLVNKDGNMKGEVRSISVNSLWELSEELKKSFSQETEKYRTFLQTFIFVEAKSLFQHYLDVIHDLASRLGKQINSVEFENGDLRVLPEPYEETFSTFIHLFRNIVDHGIEPPEDRIIAGKDSSGTIKVTLNRAEENGQERLYVRVSDDGAGINVTKIREKLRQNGKDPDAMTDAEICNSIFESGISTAAEVSDISGRGEGMGAVRAAAQKIGGTVIVEKNAPGEGCVIFINLPWIEQRII